MQNTIEEAQTDTFLPLHVQRVERFLNCWADIPDIGLNDSGINGTWKIVLVKKCQIEISFKGTTAVATVRSRLALVVRVTGAALRLSKFMQ